MIQDDLSQESLEVIYATAYGHISAGRFLEGEKLLYSLVILEPEVPKYWMALAFAQQKRGEYLEACATYYVVSSLTPEAPAPYLRAAECFFSLGEVENGLEALRETEKRIPHDPSLKEEFALLKEIWSTVNK